MRRRRRGTSGLYVDPTLACWIPMTTAYMTGSSLTDIIAGNNAVPDDSPVVGADYTTYDGSNTHEIPASFNSTFAGDFSICVWLQPDDGQSVLMFPIGDYSVTSGRWQLAINTDGTIKFLM